MRRQLRLLPSAVLATSLLAALLTGCGEEEGGGDGAAELAEITVTDPEAETGPTVEVPEPFAVEESASRVLRAGDGEVIADGDVIGMQYVLLNGRTGEELARSDWSADPTSLVVDESILAGLREGLIDKTVGSEVLVAVAPQDAFEGEAAPTQQGVGEDDTLLFLVDLVSAVPPRAVGDPVTPPPGLPEVALAEDGEPTVTIPAGTEPPGELVVQPLIKGQGPEVEAEQTIVVQYVGVKYADGTVFDSSWANGNPVPFVIGQGQVIEGWDVGLVGQNVGSQVLLIVPPAAGYGEAGNPAAGISGTDTLVFVVDILAAG